MEYKRILGKVVPTPEGAWTPTKEYDNLSLVYHASTLHAFISKCVVPVGVDIENRDYWHPLNVSGYSDSNIITLGRKNNDATLYPYTLETAIAAVAPVGRKPGVILCFYNENSDRLDINGSWELWQFNSNNVYDWENTKCWTNIYYNFNKFVGFFISESALFNASVFPDTGCYAYVGSSFGDAVIYRCYDKGTWVKTNELVRDFVSLEVTGDVTIGENGDWYVDGQDTGFKAEGPKGDKVGFRINTETLDIEYNYFKADSSDMLVPLDVWRTLYNLRDDATRFFEIRYNVMPAGTNPSVTQEDDEDNYLKTIVTFNLPAAPSVDVGTVTIGAAGTASVTNVGNRFAAVLDFVVPQGTQGPTGPTGDGVNIQYNVAAIGDLPTTDVPANAFAVVGNSSSATTYFWDGSSWIERNLTLQYNDSRIVQETGNSETNVMSQAAVSSYAAGNGYFECSTAAATAEKTVTAANYTLKVGDSIKIKFTNNNTAAFPTLNINGQGGVPIFYNGKLASETNSWRYNEVVDVYYDGASYYANPTVDISTDYAEPMKDIRLIKNLQISNGTLSNSGNTNAVRVNKKIAGTVGKVYTLYTTRPATPGYTYCYGFMRYSSMDGGLQDNKTSGNDASATNVNGQYKSIILNSGDAGFGFYIAETDGTNFHPIRITDFVGYDLFVVESGVIDKSMLYKCTTNAETVAKEITITPSSYILGISDEILVQFSYSNKAENPTLSINNETAKPIYYNGIPASETNTWNYGDVLKIHSDGTNYYAYPLSGFGNDNNHIPERINITGSGTTAGVSRLFNLVPNHRYRITLDQATWSYTPQVSEGSNAFNIYDFDNDKYNARILIGNLPTNEQTEFEFTANGSGRHRVFLRADATVHLGMTVKDLTDEDLINAANAKISFVGKDNTFSRALLSADMLKPGHKYKVSLDNVDWAYSGISAGSYKFELYYYIDGVIAGRIIAVTGSQPLKHEYTFIVPENFDTSVITLYVGGRATRGEVVEVAIEDITFDATIGPLLEQLNQKSKYETHNRLNLLYFSDVHAGGNSSDREILMNILAWGNNYRSYLDDVLHGGDIVADNVSPGNYDGWNESPYISTMLNTIGNHDCSRREDREDIDINGDGEIGTYVVDDDPTVFYNRFFAPYIENWGVTQPAQAAEQGYNYYYKDYPEATVRLIVLDSMYYTETQDQWLASVLEDARTNGLSVICCKHYPGPVIKMNVSFNSLLRTPSGDTHFLSTVQTFIDAGGKFICWLTGHMHQDFFGYLTGYPDQLEFSTVNAGVHDKNQDRYRHIYNEPDGIFNIISVSTDAGLLTIKRFGVQYDEFLRKQDTLIYDYINKAIIQNY